jgi:hypothetical protein
MKSRQLVVGLAFIVLIGLQSWSPIAAQSPSVIYTWDHAIGEVLGGPSTELWSLNGGANTIALSNTVDGTLDVMESGATAGADWQIIDSFNRIKESYNGADYGGLDLTGLSALEIEIGHNGPNTVDGALYAHIGPSSTNTTLGMINIAPGPVQTYSVPLAGLAPSQIASLRTVGVRILDHAADGNLNWSINEIRSVGTPLNVRRVADYPVGGPAPAPAAAFEGAIFNFGADDGLGGTYISGRTPGGQNNSGMGFNSADGALTWNEAPIAGGGPAPGAAVTWGNGFGNGFFPPTEFAARPIDLSNYAVARIRLRVQSTVPGEDVAVQFYTQGPGFLYLPAGPDQIIPADAMYHVLEFPLSVIPNLDQTQYHGIDLGEHNSTWAVRIDYVEYVVPEPASMAMLLIGCMALVGLVRKERS